MKTYQYLRSGILEAYLLGSTTEKEKEEVEKLLSTDADVLAELNELEASMEEYFLRNAVPPPPDIREKIELRISQTEVQKWEEPAHTYTEPQSTESEKREPSYVHVEVDNTHIRVHKYWRTAFIAIFILSKVFLILGLYYYFKAASQADEIDRLKAQTQQTSPLPRPTTP
ncbi:hypothetical protein [Spirosoma fluviale]|uniref:Uncharacterized protein n=1 Tax=Spirosoma fluviale TaxID=1597977 RepID=A0A286GC62_9BACT|nr:hypothetical protein [Spirosoma fluviale]SOD92584.1 hypothetical protein SAMN06269250_4053 [Spirosoma fluviale]